MKNARVVISGVLVAVSGFTWAQQNEGTKPGPAPTPTIDPGAVTVPPKADPGAIKKPPAGIDPGIASPAGKEPSKDSACKGPVELCKQSTPR